MQRLTSPSSPLTSSPAERRRVPLVRTRTRANSIALSCTLASLLVVGCASGKRWVASPQKADQGTRLLEGPPEPGYEKDSTAKRIGPKGDSQVQEDEFPDAPGDRPLLKLTGVKQVQDGPVDGKLLGVFRNTYYDFPSESAFAGSTVPLKNQSCEVIREVPRGFFEAVCVQGSGTLATGTVVSFSKRDCACADVCPRTGQRICFDELDRNAFPWGRGARGTPITPLRTVAVDSDLIPLGTPIYILELDGVPRKPGGPPHDGCFVAEDRGMKVQGEHVDIFTGNTKVTEHFNALLPSNHGVHVYIGMARCQ